MRRKTKQLLSFLLSLVMLVSMIPTVSVRAEEDKYAYQYGAVYGLLPVLSGRFYRYEIYQGRAGNRRRRTFGSGSVFF